MHYRRREFLKLSALSLSGLALANLGLAGCSSVPKHTVHQQFGIQLYTLRDVLPANPRAVLTELAGFGYKEIESYEGAQGIFWGMTNREFKDLMDQLGMAIVASHCDVNKDFERKAAEAGEIGMKYLLSPWVGPQKSLDDYKRIAEQFNDRGEVCRRNGLRFGYHNHDYSFQLLNGQYPQDVLMQNTDPDLVDYEMDIYWVVTAGEDPVKWFEKYPNRFRLSHVKDRSRNAAPSEKNATVVLGTGQIDFPKILASAKKHGMQHFIAEQEKYEGTTPMAAARANAEYLKKLKV